MLPSDNMSAGGATGGNRCIVNDQMGPFAVLYVLILIVGLPGNLLSIWAFVCRRRAKKQSCTVYLANLLVADILLLIALPFKLLKDLEAAPWKLMVFHCQASAVTIYISLYASIAFLAFIITDRYLQDRHSVHSLRLQEPGFAWLLSLVVWMLLLLIMVPNMALPIQQVKEQRYLSCSSLKKDISLHWHALTVFLCTALFLNASAAVLLFSSLALRRLLHSRSDPKLWVDARRVVATITVMALAYILSFVPYHVVRTPYTLTQTRVITECQTKRQLFLGKESTLLLSVAHVCFDPLLFFYLDAPFREIMAKTIPCIRKQTAGAAEETMLQAACTRQDAAGQPQI
ncbi:G-protein coupled receptor 171 [Odontesthes bonariensis]|uniref:G-protein coupled receptor 171 n=1 Tax=Odontesthes bonariensis TaxID=219752 RepID=UPI003F582CE8